MTNSSKMVSHTWSLPEFNIRQAAMLKSSDGNTFIEIFDEQANRPGEGRGLKTLHSKGLHEDFFIFFMRRRRTFISNQVLVIL